MEPKTAGMFSAGAALFLLIFGVGWPGPGTWLLVFAMLFVGAAAVAWWLEGAVVVPASGGAIAATAGAGAGGTPFSSGRPARASRSTGYGGESLLLALGLPGLDRKGHWVLPGRVHVTLVAGAVGLVAMALFIAGAVSGSSGAGASPVPVVQSNPAIDFATPVTPIVEASTNAPVGVVPTPIVVETPTTIRPAAQRPVDVRAEPAEPARTVNYEVVAGDTLYDLALEYQTSIDAIMIANGIGDTDTLRVGQRLLIPAGGD